MASCASASSNWMNKCGVPIPLWRIRNGQIVLTDFPIEMEPHIIRDEVDTVRKLCDATFKPAFPAHHDPKMDCEPSEHADVCWMCVVCPVLHQCAISLENKHVVYVLLEHCYSHNLYHWIPFLVPAVHAHLVRSPLGSVTHFPQWSITFDPIFEYYFILAGLKWLDPTIPAQSKQFARALAGWVSQHIFKPVGTETSMNQAWLAITRPMFASKINQEVLDGWFFALKIFYHDGLRCAFDSDSQKEKSIAKYPFLADVMDWPMSRLLPKSFPSTGENQFRGPSLYPLLSIRALQLADFILPPVGALAIIPDANLWHQLHLHIVRTGLKELPRYGQFTCDPIRRILAEVMIDFADINRHIYTAWPVMCDYLPTAASHILEGRPRESTMTISMHVAEVRRRIQKFAEGGLTECPKYQDFVCHALAERTCREYQQLMESDKARAIDANSHANGFTQWRHIHAHLHNHEGLDLHKIQFSDVFFHFLALKSWYALRIILVLIRDFPEMIQPSDCDRLFRFLATVHTSPYTSDFSITFE